NVDGIARLRFLAVRIVDGPVATLRCRGHGFLELAAGPRRDGQRLLEAGTGQHERAGSRGGVALHFDLERSGHLVGGVVPDLLDEGDASALVAVTAVTAFTTTAVAATAELVLDDKAIAVLAVLALRIGDDPAAPLGRHGRDLG